MLFRSESLGGAVNVRQRDNADYLTDQGNLILDTRFGPIADPTKLAAQLSERAGIVEHGLFIGLTRDLIVASVEGVKHLTLCSLKFLP